MSIIILSNTQLRLLDTLPLYLYYELLVLLKLKALLPVCMKYTAQGESQVANIAKAKPECYICHETLTKRCIFHTNKAAMFYCILHLLMCE